MREYKISPADTIGTLIKEITYDKAGNESESLVYDYLGGGGLESKIFWKYNAVGQKIEMVRVDQEGTKTTESTEYNEKGLVKKRSWTRSTGQSGTDEFTYNEKNDMILMKGLQNGRPFVTRVYTLGYDEKGRKIYQKSIEKDPEGAEKDLFLSLTHYEYRGDDTLPSAELQYLEDSTLRSREEFIYDSTAALIRETQFINGKKESINEYKYNELKECISNEAKSGGGALWFTHTYRYNPYGKKVYMMYVHTDGDAWGSRWELDYE